MSVEILPVRGGEIIALVDRAGEVGTEAQHRFAVAPFFGAHGVAGRGEQRLSVAGDAALRPDAAASGAGRKAYDLARLRSRKADDPPVIDAAIAGEAAIGNKHPPAGEGERAALVLRHRVEAAVERGRHIDRPAGLDRSVGERKRVDLVPRMAVAHDHRVEIKARARLIDDRRAGHAEGPDVAAFEPGAGAVVDWVAKLPRPDLGPGLLVERVDLVFLGRHDQDARAGLGVAPQERLRIDLAAIGRVEREIGTQAPRALVGEAGHDVPAGAIGRAVVGKDQRIGRGRNGSGQRRGERAGEHCDAHDDLVSGPWTARAAIIRAADERGKRRPALAAARFQMEPLCHSRASGNPEPRWSFGWMPAFAGMTGIGALDRQSLEIGDELGPGRLPFELLARLFARGGHVARREMREPAEIGRRLVRSDGFDRKREAPADGLGDVARRDAFLGDRVIDRARLRLFDRKPVKPGDVADMRGRPPVSSVPDIGEHALSAARS